MKEKKTASVVTNGKRKRWSAAEKLRMVLLGMEPGMEVSDVCRREGLNPTMYYQCITSGSVRCWVRRSGSSRSRP